MGYQQGLSGLQGASSDLDVIGNNIANANTVGFKAASAQFSDLYANSVSGAVANGIGIGTQLATVAQVFQQGGFATSQNPLSMAISGNGFFQVNSNGVTTYTRDGQFSPNASGNITNSAGGQLMGYGVNADGSINTSAIVPLTAPQGNIPPKATSSITGQFNLSTTDTAQTNSPFNFSDSSTYTLKQPVQAYDSLGNAKTVNLYFVKSTTVGSWEVYAGADNTAPTDLGTASFDSSGKLTGLTAKSATASGNKFTFSIANTTGAVTPQSVSLDLTGSTQFGATKSGVSNLVADGFASGALQNYSVAADGTITGSYSNGQSMKLGQVFVVNFNDPQGLTSIGGNQYIQTAASGVPQIGVPGSTNHGTIKGSTTENSTVDLTGELVNLITAQRNYQANAQTIKTQQTVDQTLLNL
ncbi:flagellar hook protein FlgE [Burkholderia glumae]|uniref:Flagellar hook protein FlgE n=2 Tax=Burkholderia glumae TaxID=337 RepID=A0AAQ0BRX3_BURGL|nr:flagellar hook protein FlgE [Burkholderia glumae]ACR30376.1 flagellar hook protein FlgE [Burkholderia glumae BGR1]AJY66190.1 flagellar hook-basal body family protein [Burkholderia glumae LMG 2196 = ATCC 33617]KHJ64254.1 flagellar hook protein FlgE [Burkholderia glumae]MCM2481972.1 flagellar hook protein FlgE [Burkholderia glumae]MCM2507885.1 flagellar hook protein FlgE [Burkholderia glumae]